MKILLTAMAAVVLLIACQQNSKQARLDYKKADLPVGNKEISDLKSATDYTTDTTTAPPPPPDGQQQKKEPGKTQPAPNPDWDKKIIKNASLNIEVKDYNNYSTSFREKVKSLGGYVSQEEQTQTDYKIENTLVIKVPVDQFDNAVILLATNAEKIKEKKITSQDVTTEFIDTKSRIEAKKQVRQRYMDLLNQARNMEEILNVQSEINGVQEEIESATGRIQYLGHSATFSTINLTYYQVLNSSAKEDEKPSFGTKAGAAFKTGWGWVTDLFVALVSIWPLFIISFILFIIYKRMKKQTPKQV